MFLARGGSLTRSVYKTGATKRRLTTITPELSRKVQSSFNLADPKDRGIEEWRQIDLIEAHNVR